MKFKKIIIAAILIAIGALLVNKPVNVNAEVYGAYYGCTGTTTNTYNAWACQISYPYDPTTPYAICLTNNVSNKLTCIPDPDHGTGDADTVNLCGACGTIGKTCSPQTLSPGSDCNIANITQLNEPQCGGHISAAQIWQGTGCGVTCSGYYWCNSDGLAYDTHYTGSGGSGSCTNNGVRDPAGDSLCGGGGPDTCTVSFSGLPANPTAGQAYTISISDAVFSGYDAHTIQVVTSDGVLNLSFDQTTLFQKYAAIKQPITNGPVGPTPYASSQDFFNNVSFGSTLLVFYSKTNLTVSQASYIESIKPIL